MRKAICSHHCGSTLDLAMSALFGTGKAFKLIGPHAVHKFNSARIGMIEAIKSGKSKSSCKLVQGTLIKENKKLIYKLLISENNKSISETEVDAAISVVIKCKRNQ